MLLFSKKVAQKTWPANASTLSALFLTAFALQLRRPKKYLTPSHGPLAGRANPLLFAQPFRTFLRHFSLKTNEAFICSAILERKHIVSAMLFSVPFCFPARAKGLT